MWRVAQEAVRNTLRHARATRLDVRVAGTGDTVTLDVVDDGVGFDAGGSRGSAHFGLRGLTSLAADSGGRLDVRSAPGAGTTVHLEVPRG